MADESMTFKEYLRLSRQIARSRALLEHDALVEPALADMALRLRRAPDAIPEYADADLDRYVAGDFTDLETRRLRHDAAHSAALLARLDAAEARVQQLGMVQAPVLRLVRPAPALLAPRQLRLAAQDVGAAEAGPVVRTCTESIGDYRATFIEDETAASCEVVLLLNDAPVVGAEVSITIKGGMVTVITDETGCGRFDLPLGALLAALGDGERTIEVVPPP